MATMRCNCVRGSRPFVPAKVVRPNLQVRNTHAGIERSFLGENFGARDARPDEIESNFGEKVIGNWNTEHIIKPPDSIKEFLGLTSRACSDSPVLLEEKQVNSFRQQVPGWRVTKTAAGTECIRFDWKVKDAASGAQLVSMIEGLFAAEKHQGKLHCVGESEVFVEMYTETVSGLSENDFICAAKINDLSVKDLLQQKRIKYWA